MADEIELRIIVSHLNMKSNVLERFFMVKGVE